ncbi:uncharacterized protein L203_106352 [Cryptococcus depauperatus CBS 7841]|uniref:Calcineurin-like phosphoesterase domain-containing protein n=1 Tax=Cryptococcus depauperatus CBS 7841 TaxID=1295531 RepID=A0AAJ8JYZ0_9TREE
MHGPSRKPIPLSAAAPNGYYVRRRKSGLRSRATQVLALRFGWVVLVIWYEIGGFFYSLSTCRFPDSSLQRGHPGAPPLTHIVLLADPHVPHPTLSYAPGSNRAVNWLKQQMDELFMRKSWNVVMRLGRVDRVLVLGDMLDWGRGLLSDQEYREYVALFRSIFQLPPTTSMHFIPGNHDIPIGPNGLFSTKARSRYPQYFEPPNTVLPIANHSFVMLDAVGLVEEDYRRYASEMQFGEWNGVDGGVIEFVQKLKDDPPPGPKILISHIPLARPERAACGPLREKGGISKGAGPGYQNLLGSETSRFLLNAIKPSLVFSGDDHDYCEYTHLGGVREVTIKSFSSSAGIRRPGFQLLSLIPPTLGADGSIPTYADRPCLLPDQLGVYSQVYLPLAVATALLLLITNLRIAYRSWDTSHKFGGSVTDLKARSSPGLLTSEQMPMTSSFSSRRQGGPVPLSLPSRKSQSNLTLSPSASTTSPNFLPRSIQYATAPGDFSSSFLSSSLSAPVSPFASPSVYMNKKFDESDTEAGFASSGYVTGANTPATMSRRPSYIHMGASSGSTFHNTVTANSHLSAGVVTPTTTGVNSFGTTRRTSAVNLSAMANPPTLSDTLPPTPRWIGLPRLYSSSSPGKKEILTNTLSPTSSHHPRSQCAATAWEIWWMRAQNFLRWCLKVRNGVIGKSWREFWSVLWVTGLVWILLNALFFLE